MEIAIGGVAGIEIIMLAFMALLAVFALRPFIQWFLYGLAYVIQGVPGVGDDIARALTGSVDSFYGAIQRFFGGLWDEATKPIQLMFNVIASNTRAMTYSARQFEHTVALGFQNLVFNTLKGAISNSLTFTQDSINTIENYTVTLVNHTESDIVAWVTTGYNNLSSWANDSINYSITLTQNLSTAVAQDVDTINQNISTVETNLVAYTQQLYGQATAYADAVGQNVTQQLDSTIVAVRDELEGSITDVRGWAEGAIADLDTKTVGEIAAATGILAAEVLPAIADITDTIEKCIKPNCDVLPDIGDAVKQIFDLVEAGALFALIASAVHNPEGTAREIANDVAAVAQAPINIFESITGLHV